MTPNATYTIKTNNAGWTTSSHEFTASGTPQTINLTTLPKAGSAVVGGKIVTSGNAAIPGVQLSLKPCGSTTTISGATNSFGVFTFSFVAEGVTVEIQTVVARLETDAAAAMSAPQSRTEAVVIAAAEVATAKPVVPMPPIVSWHKVPTLSCQV